MEKFKIRSLEVKLGATVEVGNKWIRVDRGMTMDNLKVDEELLISEIRGAYAKAQAVLEKEIVDQIKSVDKLTKK